MRPSTQSSFRRRSSFPAGPPDRRGTTIGTALGGAVIGILAWMQVRLVVPAEFTGPTGSTLILLLVALVSGIVALTPLKWALWAFAGAVVGCLLLVGGTPLFVGAIRSQGMSDPLQRCPAVVVLSSDVRPDGSLDRMGHDRLIRGLELIAQGYAGELIITRMPPPHPSGLPTVRRQMQSLEVKAPIEILGPVGNTHDEAMIVSAHAKKRKWSRLLLVTSAYHLSRARATFNKAGLPVLAISAAERSYDKNGMTAPGDRIAGFRYWLQEKLATMRYRWRGWL